MGPRRDLGRVLIISQRQLHRSPAFGAIYEFEDRIARWCDADIVELKASWRWNRALSRSRTLFQAARRTGLPEHLALRALTPRPRVDVNGRYDLLIAPLTCLFDLWDLEQVRSWRELATTNIAYVTELWPPETGYRSWGLEPVAGFDLWFSGLHVGTDLLAKIVDVPIETLPLGVDCDRFVPSDLAAPRPIEVANFGRRDDAMHEVLLQRFEDQPERYWYDESPVRSVDDHRAHRRRHAARLVQTSVSITNAAKFDRHDMTGGVKEIPGRFFEALAAGAIAVGDAPTTGVVGAEGILSTDLHGAGVIDVLNRLEDESLIRPLRHQSVAIALRHHDWAHRLDAMLRAASLNPPSMLNNRILALGERASEFEQS